VLNKNIKANASLRPLMPTEPLMSLNINIEKSSFSNKNPSEFIKQQSDSNNITASNNYVKANTELMKIEAEFEKNYVFRMKKVRFDFFISRF